MWAGMMAHLMDQRTSVRRRRCWRFFEPGDQDAQICERLAQQLRVDDLVSRLLVRRGIHDADRAGRFLHPKLTDLHDPGELPSVDAAAERIDRAVRSGQRIVIYGDYDVDGITASSILWHVLRHAGADVETYTPHRINEGYGLNNQAIRQLSMGAPVVPLVVTVDCGITALEPARVAREHGIDLIVTDHHELAPEGLPQAFAIVHPRLAGSAYPFADLCGAGVAFKVAWQFARVHCGSERLPGEFRNLLLDLLSLAALGTVADVVPLVDENRAIAWYGLGHLKGTQVAGLNALIDAARLRDAKINAYHVGFILGPRLNACGRMGHARQAVQLLTEAEGAQAAKIAAFLTRENDRRRVVERQIFAQVEQMVYELGFDRDECRAIVLGKDGLHAGVLGIVASRLVDAFCKPVVLFSFKDGQAHGSARSVPGVSIHDAIKSCAPLLKSFGGHAMAAGVRLDLANLEAFRDSVVKYVNARLRPEDLVHVIDIDAVCELGDLSLALFEQIDHLAPFGRDNTAPLLCVKDVALEGGPQRVGGQGSHLRLSLRHGRHYVQAIGFGLGALADDLVAGTRIDIVFEPKISTWRGRRQMEIQVKDLRPAQRA